VTLRSRAGATAIAIPPAAACPPPKRRSVAPRGRPEPGLGVEAAAVPGSEAGCETGSASGRPGRISCARLPERILDIDIQRHPNYCAGV
jgi:hypothetical protein